MSSETASILKKIKRLTSGGRSLNAIHLNKNLNQIEKHLMLVLAGLLDFRGLDEECSFGDAVLTIPVNQIANRMSIKRNCVISNINKLSDKGYVTKKQNFSPDDKRQLESTYMLTDQIFVEFAEELGLELETMSSCGGYLKDTGGVSERYHYLPNSIPDQITSSENQKNNKSENVCVGRSPSLRQNDTHDIGTHLDDSFVPEIPNQIPLENKPEGPQSLEPSKPRVTPQHRKMVHIFKPNADLKSYVKTNDILALTDYFISKHGDMAVKAIDWLYDDLMDKDLCGAAKWSVRNTRHAFNYALQHVLNPLEMKNGEK